MFSTAEDDSTAGRAEPSGKQQVSRQAAMHFVILLGVLSLLADTTYEGARSISGPFLATLGATGTVVGLVSGGGELLGYGLRVVSGYMSDRTGQYWWLTYIGYTLNLLAVPALALAGRWEIAAALLLLERTGKAIRTPARDAMLSHATSKFGHGWGFALHEAMDQIGAVAGPLIVAFVVGMRHEYRSAFQVLLLPALLALVVLTAARIVFPRPRDFEQAAIVAAGPRPMSRQFWTYMAAAALFAAGYADFPLIAFHIRRTTAVPDSLIPMLYALAMGVDACAALLFGWLFDRIKIASLAIAVMISSLFAPLAFLGSLQVAVLGIVVWGVGMGAQESILRAAIAGIVPVDKRGTAYGIFNAGFGLAWFVGSALMGMLYDISLPALVVFSVAAQLLAVLTLLLVTRAARTKGDQG